MGTVTGLCALAGCSRQTYYKQTTHRSRQAVDEEAILGLVRQQRQLHPHVGGRKLMVLLADELADMEIAIGRDRFFALLSEHDLLIVPKRRCTQTTNSRHAFRKWPNLIRHIDVAMVHQLWVSDLTYVRTSEGFMYLALVMDAYSRMIVGFDISDSLEAEGCVRALEMAMKQLPPGASPIHHSDRGTQYCCAQYIALLESRGCLISMTEVNHCYENAKAERLNGILKGEYGLDSTFGSKRHAKKAAIQAVPLYNERRPHTALGYRTPACVHLGFDTREKSA